MKAKDVSLWTKILAVCTLVAGLVLKGCGIFKDASIWDVVVIAFSEILVFMDVSANIIIEKFLGKRNEAP